MGTGTEFDLKTRFPNDYMDFTIDNFIVGIQSIESSNTNEYQSDEAGRYRFSAGASPLLLDKSYKNGVLSVSGIKQTVALLTNGVVQKSSVKTAVVFVYLVTNKKILNLSSEELQ